MDLLFVLALEDDALASYTQLCQNFVSFVNDSGHLIFLFIKSENDVVLRIF